MSARDGALGAERLVAFILGDKLGYPQYAVRNFLKAWRAFIKDASLELDGNNDEDVVELVTSKFIEIAQKEIGSLFSFARIGFQMEIYGIEMQEGFVMPLDLRTFHPYYSGEIGAGQKTVITFAPFEANFARMLLFSEKLVTCSRDDWRMSYNDASVMCSLTFSLAGEQQAPIVQFHLPPRTDVASTGRVTFREMCTARD